MANGKEYTAAQMAGFGPTPNCPLCGSRVVYHWDEVSTFGPGGRTFGLFPQFCTNEDCDLHMPGFGVDWGPEWKAVTEE